MKELLLQVPLMCSPPHITVILQRNTTKSGIVNKFSRFGFSSPYFIVFY